ncbi:MAG: hypothetical protein ACRCVW_04760 [Brevinema sp.]
MNIFILAGFVILLGIVVFLFSKKNPHKALIQKINMLTPYLNKNLSLDDCYIFIELLRNITLELVRLNEDHKLSHELHEITNVLLGFILSVPRIDENTDNSLSQAIEQIDKIMTTSKESQVYLRVSINHLIKILS